MLGWAPFVVTFSFIEILVSIAMVSHKTSSDDFTFLTLPTRFQCYWSALCNYLTYLLTVNYNDFFFRLYFSEHDVKAMFKTLEPLHAMLERGPQTLKEVSFHQAYGRDLNDAHEWCNRYRVSTWTIILRHGLFLFWAAKEILSNW